MDIEALPPCPEGPYSGQTRSRVGCYVPLCSNTSLNSNKIFIHVPLNIKIRKQWFEIAKRPFNVSDKCTMYACEDHFDIENDIENYMPVKMGFHKKIILKPGVLPRYFNCQVNRVPAHKPAPRPVLEKKRKLELVTSALDENTAKQRTLQDQSVYQSESETESNLNQIEVVETHRDVGIQVLIKPDTKDRASQFNVNKVFGKSKKISTEKEKNTQSIKPPPLAEKIGPIFSLVYSSCSDSSSSIGDQQTNDEDWRASFVTDISEPLLDDELEKNRTRDRIIMIVKQKPLTFLGLPDQSLHVCDKLATFLNLDLIFIYMCLVKIRLDWTFEVMSVLFGYSSPHLARIFNANIRGIAKLLGALVYWPSAEIVRYNLPIPFRHRYKDVYCIIDCLEIAIQKPTDPQHQAASWSEYKKSNTTKYLVACTPQGFVNFISKGFAGRITDGKIIEMSGFLNHLKPGMAIMADRGFKNLDALFETRGAKLVRPPSVYASTKPTKNEVKQTKQIASLRVIIENVIGRLRHFHYLTPHACIPIKTLDQLDYIIQSACGLVNIQNPVRTPV
ncbi:hypothetical protein WDU94_010905 [Cyamophila willieti]